MPAHMGQGAGLASIPNLKFPNRPISSAKPRSKIVAEKMNVALHVDQHRMERPANVYPVTEKAAVDGNAV